MSTKKTLSVTLALAFLAAAPALLAAKQDAVFVNADEVKWGPVPPALPQGAQIAVLYGDPFKKGPFIVRLKMPDGYKIPPHWHPTDENVTVIQGTFMVGKGEKFDAEASESLPAGSFVLMPKEMRHFAWAKGETIVQVHGPGPFDIHYLNPADDPSKKTAAK